MTYKGLLAAVAVSACMMPFGAEAQSSKKGGSLSSAPVVDAPVCGSLSFTDGEMICSCPADAGNGSVWGSGPYTADSNICTAARHAGAVDAAGGVIRLTEAAGQDSYEGSERNGVSTSSWGSYGSSFNVTAIGSKPVVAASEYATCSTMPSGVDEHACNCPANARQGSVWGNGPYTADSDICTAALHNGYIEAEGGDVFVLRVVGLDSYLGGDGYGVTTSDWGGYDSSIIFDWNR